MPSKKKAKVGDTIALKKPGYVRLPDGAAVSTALSYTFTAPGEHLIEGTEYDVVAADAKADKSD